jgi:hypothetical protein
LAFDFKVPDPPEEYDSKPVLLFATVSADFQLDNPFVKVSPNTKYWRVVEKTDTRIVMRVMTKCSNVPYCDTFSVEEEFVFA